MDLVVMLLYCVLRSANLIPGQLALETFIHKCVIKFKFYENYFLILKS